MRLYLSVREKQNMISIIPLSDTRITEVIDFIRNQLDVQFDETYKNVENRVLYELLLSSQRYGVCTLAVDSDEEIVGVTVNRIQRANSNYTSWSNLLQVPGLGLAVY